MSADTTTTYQKLAARFPTEDHRTRKQAGRDLTYLPGEKVISRLNDALGFGWSFKVVDQGATEVEAWVLGELSAVIDGMAVTRQQYGNQDLARGQHPTTDLFKSAATDALKKCATTIGVGLYLYDEDERREVEQEMAAQKRVKANVEAWNRPDPKGTSTSSPAPARGAGARDAASTADPTVLKTKLELIADLQRGLEFARSLGLDPVLVDGTKLDRPTLEETIDALREQCRATMAERKQSAG